MKTSFLKVAEIFVNWFISFFDYSYCPFCKKLVLEKRIEHYKERHLEYKRGVVFHDHRECPLCKKELEKVEQSLKKVLE